MASWWEQFQHRNLWDILFNKDQPPTTVTPQIGEAASATVDPFIGLPPQQAQQYRDLGLQVIDGKLYDKNGYPVDQQGQRIHQFGDEWMHVDQWGNPGRYNNQGDFVLQQQDDKTGTWFDVDRYGSRLPVTLESGLEPFTQDWLNRLDKDIADAKTGWDTAETNLQKWATTLGDKERGDISTRYDQLQHTLGGDLVSRGMYGTSAVPQGRNRLFRAEAADLERLNDQINQAVTGAQTQLDVNRNTHLGSLSTQRAAMNRLAAGDWFGFLSETLNNQTNMDTQGYTDYANLLFNQMNTFGNLDAQQRDFWGNNVSYTAPSSAAWGDLAAGMGAGSVYTGAAQQGGNPWATAIPQIASMWSMGPWAYSQGTKQGTVAEVPANWSMWGGQAPSTSSGPINPGYFMPYWQQSGYGPGSTWQRTNQLPWSPAQQYWN